MDTMKPRVSVIRIARQTLKQIDTEEIDEYPVEKRLSNRNETPILYSRDEMKTGVFDSKTPRTSVRKSADYRSQPTQNRPELAWKGTHQWSHDLFNLFDDFNMCCYACTCWCCFRHELSKMMDEHWCLWFVNCSPLATLRVKFRQQYRIQGSIAGDCCASTFCPLCVGLQLANEGRDYGHRIFR